MKVIWSLKALIWEFPLLVVAWPWVSPAIGLLWPLLLNEDSHLSTRRCVITDWKQSLNYKMLWEPRFLLFIYILKNSDAVLPLCLMKPGRCASQIHLSYKHSGNAACKLGSVTLSASLDWESKVYGWPYNYFDTLKATQPWRVSNRILKLGSWSFMITACSSMSSSHLGKR